MGSYGLTEWLSVGGSVPVVRLRASGARVRQLNDVAIPQSSVAGSTTGLGDVEFHSRVRLAGERA